jgi:hypothetical protein
MSSFSDESLTLVTFSDIKLLFLRHLSKIKSVAIVCGLVCLFFLLLREPRYSAEATFKQTAKSNEPSMNLKEAYQQLFSSSTENAVAAIMQSNEVLKDVVEELGMQVDCDPPSRLTKAIKRMGDNLLLELGRPLSDLDPFMLRHVSYLGEKPLELFLKLIDRDSYQLFDQNKQLLGGGRLGEPLSCPAATLTLYKIPKSVNFNRLYPLKIHPWEPVVQKLRKRIKIVPWKQHKTILKLLFPCRDRFLAADFLNQVMKSYQEYLKRENDEACQLQLAYLHQRQKELTQYYDEGLIDHVSYLKENLSKNGFIGVAQEIEILSHPKSLYTSKLFDVELELQRLNEERDVQQFARMKTLDEQKARELLPFINEKKQFETRLENCDLDQKRNERFLYRNYLENREFDKEAPLNLNQALPALKQLNLNKLSDAGGFKFNGCPTQSKTDSRGSFCIHRMQEGEQTRSGLNLITAQELLVGYTRERDNLQAQLREIVFLRDRLSQDDFEMSSLGGVFNDTVTADLIQKASALALQIKDDNNRSDREHVRLHEALQTQKNFLSQYLFQTIELKKLRAKLLSDKITSLRQTTVSLLQTEKELLRDKLQELNLKMIDLPEKWRRESLLMLKRELGSMMLQGISQLTEAKNLGQHIFQASSKPLDSANVPTTVDRSKIFIFSCFFSLLGGGCAFASIFCKNMLRGFPVTEENLKVAGFPISGSLSRYCNTHLSQISSADLETLRQMAEFLVSRDKKEGALVATCIGGKHPNYTLSLAELLSMRGLKLFVIDCVFDAVVHTDDQPGLWQYLNDQLVDLPIRRRLMFDHLPSGGTTRHAVELIGSLKFSSFLSQMKQKYDIILLFSRADATGAEGHAFLSLSDRVIVTVQREKKDELVAYLDWARKKEVDSTTFVYMS